MSTVHSHLDLDFPKAGSLIEDNYRLLAETTPELEFINGRAASCEGSQDKSNNNSKNSKDYFTALPSFVRGYIGSGLVALPYGYYQAGIFWGVLLTIVCCICNHYLMKLVALTCDDCDVSRNAWGNMCRVIGGRKLKFVAEISLLVSQLGACIGETLFALKFLKYTFCELSVGTLCNHNYAHVLLILVVVIPLTAVTNMRHLRWPNEIADFATLVFIIITICLGILKLGSLGAFLDRFTGDFFTVQQGGIILFCGTLIYSLGGVGAILDVRHSMTNKQVFQRVLRSGFIIVGLNFGFFGAFNSLVSLQDTKEIYLYNLPQTKISLGSQIMYLLTITMTYVTNQFPVITILESWADPNERYFHADKTDGGPKLKIIRYSMRYALVATIITIAYFLPSFSLFISFIGSFNLAVMNGLIPVITYNVHFKGRISRPTLITNLTLLLLCVILGGLGMGHSVQEMRAPNTQA